MAKKSYISVFERNGARDDSIIVVKDENGVDDYNDYKDYKRYKTASQELFDDEKGIISVYRNHIKGYGQTDEWMEFLKDAKAYVQQTLDGKDCDVLKRNLQRVYLINAKYYKDKLDASKQQYNNSGKTKKDEEIFHQQVVAQFKEFHQTCKTVVDINNRTLGNLNNGNTNTKPRTI